MVRLGLIMVAVATIGAVANATLGADELSVRRDRAQLGMQEPLPPTVAQGYSVHFLRGPIHSIKQYVNPSGVVFAVSWRGIKHPDLSILLGTHFAEYQRANSRRVHVPGRHASRIMTDKIVVRRSGHMRAKRGNAYVPNLVPSGFDVEAL